ncbi:BclA protein [Bacillus cereus]|nr:BclA protein [Bacillus cereus]
MSNNNYSDGLNPDESLSASAFDPNLVGPTLGGYGGKWEGWPG